MARVPGVEALPNSGNHDVGKICLPCWVGSLLPAEEGRLLGWKIHGAWRRRHWELMAAPPQKAGAVSVTGPHMARSLCPSETCQSLRNAYLHSHLPMSTEMIMNFNDQICMNYI